MNEILIDNPQLWQGQPLNNMPQATPRSRTRPPRTGSARWRTTRRETCRTRAVAARASTATTGSFVRIFTDDKSPRNSMTNLQVFD